MPSLDVLSRLDKTPTVPTTGVGDLFNVGVALYQEGGKHLFLQVFDKGKLGYNHGNSMLMGGVVEQTIAPTTVQLWNASRQYRGESIGQQVGIGDGWES